MVNNFIIIGMIIFILMGCIAIIWEIKDIKKEKQKEKEGVKIVKNANNIVKEMIAKKALEENQNKDKEIKELSEGLMIALADATKYKRKCKDLEKNISTLQITIENIEEICNNSNGKVVSKNKILKEIRE